MIWNGGWWIAGLQSQECVNLFVKTDPEKNYDALSYNGSANVGLATGCGGTGSVR